MSVVYVRPAMVADPHAGGAPVKQSWADAERVPAPGAFALSSTTDSDSDGTNATTAQSWSLYVPQGAPEPKPADRIEVDGLLYVQVGVLVRERHPITGWAPYAVVRLERRGA